VVCARQAASASCTSSVSKTARQCGMHGSLGMSRIPASRLRPCGYKAIRKKTKKGAA
jgi:hypothetical protein